MAAKKSASRKKTSAKGKAQVHEVMHEYKHGQLKSGGKKKAKNPKQAVAIALSEARRSGAKVAPKKSSAKSSASKKSASKKSSRKKSASKSARKASARKA